MVTPCINKADPDDSARREMIVRLLGEEEYGLETCPGDAIAGDPPN
jgi:hypothetical protein